MTHPADLSLAVDPRRYLAPGAILTAQGLTPDPWPLPKERGASRDEIQFIKNEPALPPSLRDRPDYQELIKE